MPLYSYKCTACNKKFESLVKMGAENPKCECGHETEKTMPKSNFSLKGSGWAKDGYS